MFLFVRDVCLLWEEGDLGNYTSIWVSFVCDVLFFLDRYNNPFIARVHSKNVPSGGWLIANNSDWFVFVPLTDRYHRCGSGFYRYQSSVCDGFQDCADQSDESNCKYPDQT